MKSARETELESQVEALRQQLAELTAANRLLQEQPPEELHAEQTLQALEKIDQIIEQSDDLEVMMQDLLEEALRIFTADRAWLLYPCDPSAPTWQVLMECSRAQYPGAQELKTDLPMTPDAAKVFQSALASQGPVCYDPKSGRALPLPTAEAFSIQSQIVLAIYPRSGKPWLLGMHQCSHPRIWSEADCRLFEQVGRRLPNGFSSFLTYRHLLESEARFKSMVANIPGVICRRSNDRDWTTRYISDGIKDLTGYPASDFIGNRVRSFASIIHPDDREPMLDHIAECLAAQKPLEIDYRLQHAAGHTIWVHERGQAGYAPSGELLHLDGAIFDISANKAAATEVLQLRQLLDDIINAMPSAMISVDADQQVSLWSSSAESLTGIAANEAIGRPVAELLPELFQAHPELDTALKAKQVIKVRRYLWPSSQGARVKEITVFPLSNGNVEGAVLRIEDIHERLQLEQALIQNEKMLSVGTLAAGMAHEINNPLAGILQNLQVMQNRFSPSLKQNLQAAEKVGTSFGTIDRYLKERQIDQLLSAALASSGRAAQIVQNLLNFSRQTDSNLLAQDIPEILEQVIELAGSDFNLKHQYDFRNIQLRRDYAPDLPKVPCESNQLQQVFLNLLNNSAYAINEKLQQLPAEQRGSYQPTIQIQVRQEQDSMWIEIRDNGCGIQPTAGQRIFDPFYTTKAPGEGTGLGLAISFFIIEENHGGRISVTSTPEVGTSFHIELPL